MREDPLVFKGMSLLGIHDVSSILFTYITCTVMFRPQAENTIKSLYSDIRQFCKIQGFTLKLDEMHVNKIVKSSVYLQFY